MNTNTNKIIIFGNKDMAELACFYFRNDSNYVPVAFCVDGAYLKESRFNDLPVIAFEDIEKEDVAIRESIKHAKEQIKKLQKTIDTETDKVIQIFSALIRN